MLKMVEVNLEFEDVEAGQLQYDPDEMRRNMIVPARYIKVPGSEGNPYISALTRLPDQGEFLRTYGGRKPEVNVRDVNRMTELEMLDRISIQQFSVPLWYYHDTAKCIRRLLLKSYSGRQLYTRRSTIKDDEDEVEAYCRREKDRPEFAMLIGPSGCGKTHLIESISNMYPRVIRHSLPETTFTEIPVLSVTTQVKNLSGLLNHIASKLDELLDWGDFHRTKMEGKRNLGAKIPLLEDWIKSYAVGLILIDEAQFIDFGKIGTGESVSQRSVENLITVSENTGVAFMFVGNPELQKSIDGFDRMRSRIGTNVIDVNEMGAMDRNLFEYEAGELWKQLYIKNRPELSKSMMSELAFACAYNMCILVTLFKELQYRSAIGKKVTEDTVVQIYSNEMFEDMRSCLRVGGEAADKKLKQIRDSVNNKIETEKKRREKLKSEAGMQEFLRSRDEERATSVKEKALEIIKVFTNVPSADIETAFRRVYGDDPLQISSKSAEAVAKAVIDDLDSLNKKAEQKAKRGKRTVNRPPASDAVKADITDIVNKPLQIGGESQ